MQSANSVTILLICAMRYQIVLTVRIEKGTWIDTITSLLGTKAVVVLEDGKVETYPLDRLKVITKRER